MILKSASPSRSFVLGNSKRVCRSAARKVRVDELEPLRSVFLTLHGPSSPAPRGILACSLAASALSEIAFIQWREL
jgi:hypothetical protein